MPWQVGQWTVSPELCLLEERRFVAPSSAIVRWLSSWPLCRNPAPPRPPAALPEAAPIPGGQDTHVYGNTQHFTLYLNYFTSFSCVTLLK